MRVGYHPLFAQDIKRIESQYGNGTISPNLAGRFRAEVDQAIEKIKTAPTAAGHFLNTGSNVVKKVRRRNLHSFPFCVLYSESEEMLFFAEVKPVASNPLSWLKRFPEA